MTAERKAGDTTAVRMVINWLGLGLFALLGVAAVVPLFLIIGDVYIKGIDAINRLGGLWHFLTGLPPTPYEESGGIGPMLVGTLYMTVLGALLGIAVGFPLGVYIGEMRREKFSNVARAGINVLVEFPTIVIGLFVYAVMSLAKEDLNRYLLDPFSNAISPVGGWITQFIGPLDGFNAYAGAAALSIIMIPYVALITASAYASIEQPLREAAYATAGREFNALFVVLRKAVSRAVLTAALLGTAKIAGETAPLLFTAFGNFYYGPFTGPTAAVPLWVWYAAQTPYEVQIASAYGAAAVLLTIILTVFIIARIRG
jgi:phosphate ABC transporter membrane protein 2, PhoT family (TC 3.A.1.7.1)